MLIFRVVQYTLSFYHRFLYVGYIFYILLITIKTTNTIYISRHLREFRKIKFLNLFDFIPAGVKSIVH